MATASGKKTLVVASIGSAVKSWRSKPFRRWGRACGLQLSQDLQWEEHRSGSATPVVQRGSMPRRLFFVAQHRIAITWKPK